MLIAVYGTLRNGDYNHDYWMKGHKPLSTEEIQGFDMYSLGSAYPYITPSKGTIEVELYELPQEILGPIERMERGAGYEMAEVETSRGTAQVFYMTTKRHKHLQEQGGSRPPKILSGNWFEWLRKHQPERVPA